MPIYAEAGVQYLWLADPGLLTLETYQLVAAQCTLTGSFKDADKMSAEPFEAIEIDLSSLWRTTAEQYRPAVIVVLQIANAARQDSFPSARDQVIATR